MVSSLANQVAKKLGPEFGVSRRPPKEEPREHLTYPDVERMIEHAPNERDGALVAMLFYTGARVSEVLEVKVDDLRRDRLRIQRLKKRRIYRRCPECDCKMGRPYAFCSSCGIKVDSPVIEDQGAREMAFLPFVDPLRAIVRAYLRKSEIIEGYLFPGLEAGTHLHRSHVYRIIRECAARIGIVALESHGDKEVWLASPHRLRDALAIQAVEQDDSTDSIRALQEQLGHSSMSTTMRYRRVSSKAHRAWYDRLWPNDD